MRIDEFGLEPGVRSDLRRSLAQSHETKYGGEVIRDFGTGGYGSIQWGPIQFPLRHGCDGRRRAARFGEDVKITSDFLATSYKFPSTGKMRLMRRFFNVAIRVPVARSRRRLADES